MGFPDDLFRYVDRWQLLTEPNKPLNEGDLHQLEVRDVELEDYLSEIRDEINGRWIEWTPTLTATVTNPTLGTGAIVGGIYKKIGQTIIGTGNITFGTAGVGAGSGNYNVDLPPDYPAQWPPSSVMTLQVLGPMWLNNSGGATSMGVSRLIATNQVRLVYHGGGSTGATNAAPWAWAASDSIFYNFCYQIAAA